MADRIQSRRDQRGFSLLELLVVLAILALIAGIAGPRLMGVFGQAKAKTAVIQMRQIKGALDIYHLENGRYPTSEEGLKALVVAPAGVDFWTGPYLDGEEALTDPWGKPYLYRPAANGGRPKVVTFGADHAQGGSGDAADLEFPTS